MIWGRFPGPHSPGLIEAVRTQSRDRRKPKFPGPHSPGLIEAMIKPIMASLGITGFPGPHSPGLIEA